MRAGVEQVEIVGIAMVVTEATADGAPDSLRGAQGSARARVRLLSIEVIAVHVPVEARGVEKDGCERFEVIGCRVVDVEERRQLVQHALVRFGERVGRAVVLGELVEEPAVLELEVHEVGPVPGGDALGDERAPLGDVDLKD